MTAPANDNFASAIALTAGGGVVSTTTTAATIETDEPEVLAYWINKSVWYTWTPAAGPVRIRSDNDQIALAVWVGSALGALTPITGDEPGFYGSHRVEWEADGTTTYRIQVKSYGSYTANLTYGPYTKTANDDIADAATLDPAGGTLTYDNTNAGLQLHERPRGDGVSLWYKLTPTADVSMAFDIGASPSSGSMYGSMLLYDAADLSLPAAPGYAVSPLAAVTAPRMVVALQAGHTYYLRTDANTPHTDNVLTWGPVTPPDGDAYDDAVPLDPPAGGTVGFDMSDATRDAGADEWDWTGGGTLWFSYTADMSGTAIVHTRATPSDSPYGADTYLAVFADGAVVPSNSSTPIVDFDDDDTYSSARVSWAVEPGVTYMIQLAAYDAISDGILSWRGPQPARPRRPQHTVPMIWTSTPDRQGSDRVYLGQLGAVSGLRYSTQYAGGSKSASCTLQVPPDFTHRALTPGRDVGITVGAEDVWNGTLAEPIIADDGSRQIVADGDSATTAHFVALGLGTHNALNANEVIDATQLSGRHGRFRRVDDLPHSDGLWAPDAAFMMDEALTQNAASVGKRWRVDRDRVIRYYPQDGDGTRLLLRARHDVGRTLDGFATKLVVIYEDAATGLRQAEHLDAEPADTGSTYYPEFYKADSSGYSARNFTLYVDGSTITAYAMSAPATATVLSLDSPAVDLALVETSQFYSRWVGTGSLAVGATGRTATYRAATGTTSLGTGSQDGPVHRGRGSLGPTGNIAPRETILDLTSQGAFTLAQAREQLVNYRAKIKTQPHYTSAWTAMPGDLLNSGGVPVDLAVVQAGAQLAVLAVDPSRNLSLGGDTVLVTTGEVEYDVDTQTLTLTPVESPELADRPVYVDPATGLQR